MPSGTAWNAGRGTHRPFELPSVLQVESISLASPFKQQLSLLFGLFGEFIGARSRDLALHGLAKTGHFPDPSREVVVVTMGPPPAEGMLRELLARGADKAVLVSGREFGGSDTFATSQILAAAVNKIGVGPEDVVFCGRQAIDGDTAQVGPQIAEKLHLPQVTYVADIQKDGNTLTVKRMLEDGYMMVKVQTPCLLTCIKELNQPRYMSVNGIFTCYDKPMEVFDYNALKDDPLIEVDTIGLKGSPTNVFKSFTPPQKGAGTMLKGDDTAAQLAGILAKKHLI